MFSQIKVKRKPQINDTDTKNEYANVINSIWSSKHKTIGKHRKHRNTKN